MSKAPKPKSKTTGVNNEVMALHAALQRERADSINLRRQFDEQISGLRTQAKAHVIKELLPVIDNLERALKHLPKALEKDEYVKGVLGIAKQFEKVLADLGVERIKTVGEEFDPRYHEAVSMEDSQGTFEVVCEELQAGYRLGEEVIRPAMVKVKMEAAK